MSGNRRRAGDTHDVPFLRHAAVARGAGNGRLAAKLPQGLRRIDAVVSHPVGGLGDIGNSGSRAACSTVATIPFLSGLCRCAGADAGFPLAAEARSTLDPARRRPHGVCQVAAI